MRRIYFVRHGETAWNRLGKIQGQADIPLNETGRQEAAGLASCLSGVSFDFCCCSPLVRARETAEIILKEREHKLLIPHEQLIEIAYGVDEGQSLEWIHRDESLPLHNYFAAPGQYIPPEGGETLSHLFGRCRGFLGAMEALPEDGTILAVCHGAFIRGMLCVVQSLPQADFWKGREQKNCAVTIVEEESGRWYVAAEALEPKELQNYLSAAVLA